MCLCPCVPVCLFVCLLVCLVDLFYVYDQCGAQPVFEAHKLCLGGNYCMSNDIIVS